MHRPSCSKFFTEQPKPRGQNAAGSPNGTFSFQHSNGWRLFATFAVYNEFFQPYERQITYAQHPEGRQRTDIGQTVPPVTTRYIDIDYPHFWYGRYH